MNRDFITLMLILGVVVIVAGGLTAILIPWPEGCVLIGPFGIRC